MNLVLLESAQQELEEAAGYYEALESGLGIDFGEEFYRSVERICANPASYPLVAPNTRRCLVRRFKHAIVFEIETARIVVFAVIHERKNPKTWQDRL